MKLLEALALTVALPLMAQAAPVESNDTITIFMIGDSTMANKPLDKENQERGWGQMLPLYFTGKIRVDNRALNGRSSKSFVDEGRWAAVMEKIRPGDYVIIQFGHNDEKVKDKDRYTEPGSTFDEYLRNYVDDARSKGATPILMNSIVRRHFPVSASVKAEDRDDNPPVGAANDTESGSILVDTHGAYREAPRKVAAETGVTFIDMNSITNKLVQGLGPTLSKDLFMWIPAGEYEFCPDGKSDNTHLNIHGALVVSRLAAQALAAQVPELRPYVRREVYNLNK